MLNIILMLSKYWKDSTKTNILVIIIQNFSSCTLAGDVKFLSQYPLYHFEFPEQQQNCWWGAIKHCSHQIFQFFFQSFFREVHKNCIVEMKVPIEN